MVGSEGQTTQAVCVIPRQLESGQRLELQDRLIGRLSKAYSSGQRVMAIPGLSLLCTLISRGLNAQEALMLYGYSIVSTMVQNAVRAIPLELVQVRIY